MDYIEEAQRVLFSESEALLHIAENLNQDFCKAIDLIHEASKDKKKICFMGIGKSGLVARKIASMCSSLGTSSYFLDISNALHGDLGNLNENEVVVIFSKSGNTPELIKLLKSLNNSIIAITCNLESTLAMKSTIVIYLPIDIEACPLNLAPTNSTIAMMALGDALAIVLGRLNGITAEQFAKYHPGGQLGKRLTLKVKDVMREIKDCAVVEGTSTLRETIQKITTKRSGCAIVCPIFGRDGIFTDGDLRRALNDHKSNLDEAVRVYMTENPITIDEGALVVAAIELFNEYQIDDLIVCDDKDQIVGILDIQDVIKEGLLNG